MGDVRDLFSIEGGKKDDYALMAKELYKVFAAYVAAGFTAPQAIDLLKVLLAGSLNKK